MESRRASCRSVSPASIHSTPLMMAPPPATPSRACGPRPMKNGNAAAVPIPITPEAIQSRASTLRPRYADAEVQFRSASQAQPECREDSEHEARWRAARRRHRFRPAATLPRRGSCRRGVLGGIQLCDAPDQHHAGGQQVESARPAHSGCGRGGPEHGQRTEAERDGGPGEHGLPEVRGGGQGGGRVRGCGESHPSSLVRSGSSRTATEPESGGSSATPSTIHRSRPRPEAQREGPGQHVAQREGGPQPEQPRAAVGPGSRTASNSGR